MTARHIKLLLVLGLSISAVQFGMTGSAQAGTWWLEPYGGYEKGNRKQNQTSYDSSGINLGFRLGFNILNTLYFGPEYALASLTVDFPNDKDDIQTKDLGLFVGSEFGKLRIWGTYWLDSKGASHDAGGTYSGDGYKAGIGLTVFSQASLNLEKTLRIWRKLDSTKIANVEVDAIMISLSLPFTF